MWKLLLVSCFLVVCSCASADRHKAAEPRRIWVFETYCFDPYYPSDFPERAFQTLRHAPPDEMYVIGDGVHKFYDAASGQPMPTVTDALNEISRYRYSSGELPDIYYQRVFAQLAKGHTELILFSGGYHSPLHMELVTDLIKDRAKTESLSISVITRNTVGPDTLAFHRALIVRGSITILSRDQSNRDNPKPSAKSTLSHSARQTVIGNPASAELAPTSSSSAAPSAPSPLPQVKFKP